MEAAALQKVLVIGSPGAGKSTFSRRLQRITGLPLFHLDLLWHRADRTTCSEAEFDRKLEELLSQERWIIDGNYLRTLERRLEACSGVFLLEIPTEICLAGVYSRLGKKREDLPWVEETLDAGFRQWIVDFPRDQLPRIHALLRQYRGTVTVFHSRQEADRWLEALAARQ